MNVGCVPSKALLRAGETYWAAGHHPLAGIDTSAGPVDLAALVVQKDELVSALRQETYASLVDPYGFEVITGHGRFVDADTVEVDGRRIHAGAVLVATGASPTVPPRAARTSAAVPAPGSTASYPGCVMPRPQIVIENPILNTPFAEPERHSRFDDQGITDDVVEGRRPSSYFMPIPKKPTLDARSRSSAATRGSPARAGASSPRRPS